MMLSGCTLPVCVCACASACLASVWSCLLSRLLQPAASTSRPESVCRIIPSEPPILGLAMAGTSIRASWISYLPSLWNPRQLVSFTSRLPRHHVQRTWAGYVDTLDDLEGLEPQQDILLGCNYSLARLDWAAVYRAVCESL